MENLFSPLYWDRQYKSTKVQTSTNEYIHVFDLGRGEDQKLFCSTCVGHFFEGACCCTAIDESGKVIYV